LRLKSDESALWGVHFEKPMMFFGVILWMFCLIMNTLHFNGVTFLDAVWAWSPIIIFAASCMIIVSIIVDWKMTILGASILTILYYFLVMSGQFVFFTTAGVVS
jgi:hypothetical protein